MAVIETLAIHLGPVIAKAILKIWLKDDSIVLASASKIADVLSNYTADLISARDAARQFEATGDRVAKNIAELFELEGDHLDTSSQTAVAIAIAGCISKADITAASLVRVNLDPAALESMVIADSSKFTVGLNQSEVAFFKRIVSELSQNIIDISSQLPNFSEASIAELLTRSEDIVNIANQILDEVKVLRAKDSQENVSLDYARFDVEYRRLIIRKLDYVQMFGLDMSPTSHRRYRLSMAYIHLAAATNKDIEDAEIRDGANKTGAIDAVNIRGDTVLDILGEAKKWIIAGDAGSGKTTLMQWIAVHAAKDELPKSMVGWTGKFPFLVRLRQFSKGKMPTTDELSSLLSPVYKAPEYWTRHKLDQGNAIVLVDGLDEIGHAARRKVHEWLEDLLAKYPDLCVIVTSRSHALKGAWGSLPGFVRADLQSMDASSITEFIRHWHNAVASDVIDPEEKNKIQQAPASLIRRILENRSYYNLATNPLLCAVLCALNRTRHENLPADRIELYGSCCGLLLERRDKERDVDLREYPKMHLRQMLLLLQDFAYWMLRNEYPEVEASEVDSRFCERSEDMEISQGECGPEGLRRYFVERSGILREPIPDKIDFTHRTFQEFLAARSILDEGDIGVLVANANDDRWREVIVLAVGLANKKQRESIINQLLGLGEKQNKGKQRIYLLVVACMESAVELSKDIKGQVRDKLSSVIPPRTLTEAKALSSAGDLATPRLGKSKRRRATTDAACIRALAEIGTDHALEVLATYATDTRATVASELLKSWDRFNRTDYAQKVLAKRISSETNIRSLQFRSVPNLDGFEYLGNLKNLHIDSCHFIDDYSSIGDLAELQSLNLGGVLNLEDLSFVCKLKKLHTLFMLGAQSVSNFEALEYCGKLSRFALTRCQKLQSINQLSTVSVVEFMWIYSCPNISSLDGAENLQKLKYLSIAGCDLLKDLSALAALPNLATLFIEDCSLYDFTPLRDCNQIEIINIRTTSPNDLVIPSTLKSVVRINEAY